MTTIYRLTIDGTLWGDDGGSFYFSTLEAAQAYGQRFAAETLARSQCAGHPITLQEIENTISIDDFELDPPYRYVAFELEYPKPIEPAREPETYRPTYCPNCGHQVGGPMNVYGMLKCVWCHTAFAFEMTTDEGEAEA